MKNSQRALSTALLTALLVAPSFAHHNITAVFDTSKPLTIKGTLTKIEWRNPHTSIYIDVKDATGKITNWWVELPAIATLAKAGLDQSMLELSQTYSIEGYQAKSGAAQVVGITLTFPDSKAFDVAEKPNLSPPAK